MTAYKILNVADFVKWVTACEPSLPWEPGDFLDVFKEARRDRMSDQVDYDEFARTIRDFVMDREHPEVAIEVTPIYLLTTLENRLFPYTTNLPIGWPKDAARLGTKIRRIAPIL